MKDKDLKDKDFFAIENVSFKDLLRWGTNMKEFDWWDSMFHQGSTISFVPMHYDEFRLADDTPIEALDRLLKKWKDCKLDIDNPKNLKLGETLVF